MASGFQSMAAQAAAGAAGFVARAVRASVCRRPAGLLLWEAAPAAAALSAPALRRAAHFPGHGAAAHAGLRSLSSRAEVINPSKGASAGAEAPFRSSGAASGGGGGGGGCGSPVAGAPGMMGKLEQKAIDELEDMSIVDEVVPCRPFCPQLRQRARVLTCAQSRLCPVASLAGLGRWGAAVSSRCAPLAPWLTAQGACAQDDEDGAVGWTNPETGEVGGPKGSLRGAEPTRFGDWEQNG